MKIGLLDNVEYGGCNDLGGYSVLLIDVQFGCGSVVTLLPSLWKHGICQYCQDEFSNQHPVETQYKVKLNDGDKPCDGARGKVSVVHTNRHPLGNTVRLRHTMLSATMFDWTN